MIELKKNKQLTEDEVRGLFNTELFADLMQNKYSIVADTTQELNKLLSDLNNETFHGVWYFHRSSGGQGRAGMLYLSASIDAHQLEKLENENWCKNRTV
jgi:hypothetical protein